MARGANGSNCNPRCVGHSVYRCICRGCVQMDFDTTGLILSPNWAPHVLDFWICGSAARGDMDSLSDVDLTFVVTDEVDPADLQGNPVTAIDDQARCDASVYTLSGFAGLVDPPSLFAWHLALEGQHMGVSEGPAAALLKSLRPFEDHAEDLQVLCQLAREAANALEGGQNTMAFELGVLATAVRNTALVVTHFDGMPDFSRSAPLRLLDHTVVPLPFHEARYAALAQARKAGEGVVAAPKLSHDQCRRVASCITEWISRCIQYVGGPTA